jgi:protoheme IX farnesyltransferase
MCAVAQPRIWRQGRAYRVEAIDSTTPSPRSPEVPVTYVGQPVPAPTQATDAPGDPGGRDTAPASFGDVVAAYVGLTKPRVIELLLLTTVPVMFFAARGVPELWLVVATVVGGTLSAGSASVFNCVYDRDIDEQMRRTRRRALPRHIVSPGSALVFGFVLGIVSTLVLYYWVNPLSAALSVGANAFYVFVYTMLLKRRTTQNIVWGGIAGCFPALIGWTAVTGELGWPPVILFLVVFFWTPPHTWALALRYREDYAQVDVPMLPAVAPAVQVGRQIVLYSWVMVATSMVLWPVAGTGWFYPAAAGVLGVVFLVEAHRMWLRTRESDSLTDIRPMRLFHFSNLYLSLLFVAVALDPLLAG